MIVWFKHRTKSLQICLPFTRCQHENRLKTSFKWKRNAYLHETKTEPFLSPCQHPMPVGFHDSATSRLITQRNKAGTIWCYQLSTKKGAVKRICFIPASCERFSVRNRILPVPGQWCRFQIIPASCERGLNMSIISPYRPSVRLARQKGDKRRPHLLERGPVMSLCFHIFFKIFCTL